MVARKSYSLWNHHFEICLPKINLRKESKKKKDLEVEKILIFAFLNRVYKLTPRTTIMLTAAVCLWLCLHLFITPLKKIIQLFWVWGSKDFSNAKNWYFPTLTFIFSESLRRGTFWWSQLKMAIEIQFSCSHGGKFLMLHSDIYLIINFL